LVFLVLLFVVSNVVFLGAREPTSLLISNTTNLPKRRFGLLKGTRPFTAKDELSTRGQGFRPDKTRKPSLHRQSL
jgi:hypothetical protein